MTDRPRQSSSARSVADRRGPLEWASSQALERPWELPAGIMGGEPPPRQGNSQEDCDADSRGVPRQHLGETEGNPGKLRQAPGSTIETGKAADLKMLFRGEHAPFDILPKSWATPRVRKRGRIGPWEEGQVSAVIPLFIVYHLVVPLPRIATAICLLWP